MICMSIDDKIAAIEQQVETLEAKPKPTIPAQPQPQ